MICFKLGLDLVALRWGGSRFRMTALDSEVLLELKSGNKVPEPLSAARSIFRSGFLGALSLCAEGGSLVVACLRIGLNLGDTMFDDRLLINIDDDVLVEDGAGTFVTLEKLPNRGTLLALAGAVSTGGVELLPFIDADDVECP